MKDVSLRQMMLREKYLQVCESQHVHYNDNYTPSVKDPGGVCKI